MSKHSPSMDNVHGSHRVLLNFLLTLSCLWHPDKAQIILAICLSIVLASSVWASFGHQKSLKNHPSEHPIFFTVISKNCKIYAFHIIDFFHFNIIPLTLYKDSMPYSNKLIHI